MSCPTFSYEVVFILKWIRLKPAESLSNARGQKPRCPYTHLIGPFWIIERQTCPWALFYLQTSLSSIPVWSYEVSSELSCTHPVSFHPCSDCSESTRTSCAFFMHSHMPQICLIFDQSFQNRLPKTIGSCQHLQDTVYTAVIIIFFFCVKSASVSNSAFTQMVHKWPRARCQNKG